MTLTLHKTSQSANSQQKNIWFRQNWAEPLDVFLRLKTFFRRFTNRLTTCVTTVQTLFWDVFCCLKLVTFRRFRCKNFPTLLFNVFSTYLRQTKAWQKYFQASKIINF